MKIKKPVKVRRGVKKGGGQTEGFYGQVMAEPTNFGPAAAADLVGERLEDVDENFIYFENRKKDKSQKRKMRLVYAGVFGLTAVIMIFWLLNVREGFGKGLGNPNSSQDLSAIVGTLQNALGNFSQAIGLQKQAADNFLQATENIIIEEKVKNDITEQMKNQIEGSQNLNLTTN